MTYADPHTNNTPQTLSSLNLFNTFRQVSLKNTPAAASQLMMGSQTSYSFLFLVLFSLITVFKKRLSLIYQLFLGLFINRSVKPKKVAVKG